MSEREGSCGRHVHPLWNTLMSVSSECLGHELWCSAIRTVARRKLNAEGWKPEQDDDVEHEEDAVDELVKSWQDDSMPVSAELGWILGECDYFRDFDVSWDEKLSLTGAACGYPTDVQYDLSLRYSDREDAITLELIEDFYSSWCFRFMRRVCEEAERLNDD